jgi:hypothetical protein
LNANNNKQVSGFKLEILEKIGDIKSSDQK